MNSLASDRALRAGLAALTYAFGREVTVAILARLLGDLPDRESIERQVLDYIAQVYNVTRDDFRAAIRQARPEQEEELMTTLAEQWKARLRTNLKARPTRSSRSLRLNLAP